MQIPGEILETLARFKQEHLVQHWDRLEPSQREKLLDQIQQIDFPLMDRLIQDRTSASEAGESATDRAKRATSPQQLIRLPLTERERKARQDFVDAGEELLHSGKVGAILVAGGQGSRLGFDAPKGTFPIGPVSDRTLFQVLCEQVLARTRRANAPIPYFIMTSEATHRPTVAFFEKHRYFGLEEENVFFFQQASLPAVEDSSHRILLESPWRIVASPDGHGGMLRAAQRHGIIEVMRERGVEHLYYHQVDNPTAIVCDPALLGAHVLSDSDLTTKVVAKKSPSEKMGVLVDVDGQTQIIEYSDLPQEESTRRGPDGSLVFWAGNTAIHVFRRAFLESLLEDDLSLPFHVAHKKTPGLDAKGRFVEPTQPNAHKFEQFIFDALPHAAKALVVEGDRAREFNPVKNAEGADSPETSRAALAEIARDWVNSAGGSIAEDAIVEISPLYALDASDLQIRLPRGVHFDKNTVLQ